MLGEKCDVILVKPLELWGAGYDSKEQTAVPKIRNGTFPETNISHLRMDRWNTSFLLRWPMFFCHVSFRESNSFQT